MFIIFSFFQGRTYCFISNIDNLGATVDLNILNHIFSSKEEPEFVIELTDKTKADVKVYLFSLFCTNNYFLLVINQFRFYSKLLISV